MSLLFRTSEVKKEYLGIVRGYTPEESLIDYPLNQMLDTREQKNKVLPKKNKKRKHSLNVWLQLSYLML